MQTDSFFPYSWHIDESETEITSIRIYGLNNDNKNVCLRVDNFTPYVYIELPTKILWNSAKAQLVGNKIDEIMGRARPIKKVLMMKKKLYGAYLDITGKRKEFPYLFCSFSTRNDIKMMGYKLQKPINVSGMGTIQLKVHESDADPILQLTCCRQIYTAGWLKFAGKTVHKDDQITLCDQEYTVLWKNLTPEQRDDVPKPKIMGFDIEVNSSNPSAMPKATKPPDKIFQISCVMSRCGDPADMDEKYLLSLGEPDQDVVGGDTLVYMYNTEADLLDGFVDLIREENPNIITGYNILGFDIPYMIARAKLNMCISTLDRQGFHKTAHAKEKIIKWSSSAYKNQEFEYLDAEGRVYVDLLPLVKRDFKFNNYKLSTIAEYFIGASKDPLTPKGIFKCYRIGMKRGADGEYGAKAKKALGVVGKYCVVDSVLVIRLMEKLKTWVGLTEMAKTCGVSVFALYTQGQQIKVYSQLYRYCMVNNIVVEKDGYQVGENERYVGAKVFPPIPGQYKMVIPLDFCFTGDTLVTMSNGCSRRIDTLLTDSSVLGYTENGLQNFVTTGGLQVKGQRETIKLYLESGKVITCTPDHKFMLSNGEWERAENLNDTTVMCGIDYPEDSRCELEEAWSLTAGGYIFDMKFENNRDQALAFSRIVGYILSDGSIYLSGNRKRAEACFGTIIDTENFKRDVSLFSDVDVKIRLRESNTNTDRDIKGTTYTFSIPSKLCKAIHSLCGIVVGKRATQAMTLPQFVLDENCPTSIVREFLGGLYGGDGCAPYLAENKGFGSISFKWTTIEKYRENMLDVFEKLVILHGRCDITCHSIGISLVKYYKDSIKPKDYIENPRYDILVSLPCDQTLGFSKNIGFRYCINKSCKLSIVASYQLFCDKVRSQSKQVVDRTNVLIDTIITNVFSRKKGSPTFSSCLEQAQNELLQHEPKLNKYSLSSVTHISYTRYEAKRNSHKPCKMSVSYKKGFPTPKDFIENLGVENWFTGHAVKTKDTHIPCYQQKVIDIRSNGIQEVYDIEVDKAHNFIANGVVAHNCSLYPTIIIAYNIDYHTWVPDDSNIPDSKCHVMEWADHQACLVEGTKVTIGEYSVPIETMTQGGKVLAYDSDTKGLSYYDQTRLYNQGIKSCVELTFEDGTTLQCTPDHKIRLGDGTWVEAQNIKIDSDRITCGYSPPVYDVGDRDLVIDEFTFRGQNLVKFYKILGLVLVNEKNNWIYYENMTDMDNLIRDIISIGGKYHVIDNNVMIYGNLGKIMYNTSITITSNSEIAALLSGMFGRNGCSSFINNNQDISTISFVWPGKPDIVAPILDKISSMLHSLNIHSTLKFFNDNGYLYINTQDTCLFRDIVGFSYCNHKSARLEAICSFITYKGNSNCVDYLNSIGAMEILFAETSTSTCLFKRVMRRVCIGEHRVYDIEVDKSHSFVANGVVVHNCCHDPKVIRKKELNEYISLEEIQIKKLRERRNRTSGKDAKQGMMNEINRYLEDLKPYKTERSDLTKTIAKVVMCEQRRYRFLKEPRGVMPTVIQNLLDARKHTRKVDMKACKVEIARLEKDTEENGTDNTSLVRAQNSLLDVLDKRQLAYKVSCNSMYGAMGVRRGYLPFMPGAMVTCFKGRENITLVAETIPEKYGGELVYGDTDSNYIHFPHLTTAQEIWDHSIYVAEEVTKLFPKPMVLEFEEQIYSFFFILSKKRYMYRKCLRDGVVDPKIGKKGVLLARRDNSKFIRDIYEHTIGKIADNVPSQDIIYWVLQEINQLCSGVKPLSEFTITKAVGNAGGLVAEPFINEKGIKKAMVGDYTVPILVGTKAEQQEQMEKKGATTADEYYLLCLPAQVQLAERMKRRGQRVDAGSRLEYVVSNPDEHTAKQYEKVECAEYLAKHSGIVKLDYLYYLKQLVNPMDQMLDVAFGKEKGYKLGMIMDQYKYRWKVHGAVIKELNNLFRPKIIIEN